MMENEKKSSLHDSFFKESMENIDIAQETSQLLLPERIPDKIDYSSLSIEKGAWINFELRLNATDILYRAELEETRKPVLLLFEHKSVVDHSVEFQNIRNTVHIFEGEKRQEKVVKHDPPPVIPIVIYHGNYPWITSNNTSRVVELYKSLELFIPHQKNIIIDLSVIPDEKILGSAEVKAFLFALKYSRSTLLFEKLPQIISFFNGVGLERLQYLETVILYLKLVIPEDKRAEFSKIVENELKLGDEEMKKKSNIWAELGYDAGIDDGLKKGIDIGIKKGEDIGIKKGEDIGIKKGIDIGVKKGIQIEQAQEKKKEKDVIKHELEMVAVSMIKKGIKVEDICEITGLLISEVLELKKRIENGEL